ncbi:ZN574 protein, partial [Alcedo cyanopectus]|nr:ZN574 protein [Ceyx cyanopectus]
MSCPEETVVLLEHRYVCSECNHLSACLESALEHQQLHLGASQQHQYQLGASQYQLLAEYQENQYQCLECGQLLVSPGQLLEHQELHIKLLGQDHEATAASPLPTASGAAPAGLSGVSSGVSSGIHYECVECRALFTNQELWLSHRQNHRRPPGGGQQQQQQQQQRPREQPEPPSRVQLEHSYLKQDGDGGAPGVDPQGGPQGGPVATPGDAPGPGDTVQLLLYECGDCFQLFPTPKDFLEHQ